MILEEWQPEEDTTEEAFPRYEQDDLQVISTCSSDFNPRIPTNVLSADDHCLILDGYTSIQSPMQYLQIRNDPIDDDTTTVLNNIDTLKTPEDDISMYLPPQDTHATHPILVDISSNDNIIEERATESSDTDEEQTRAIDGRI